MEIHMTAKMEWVTGVLETTEVSENSHPKIRAFSHEKVAESTDQLKHIYINAHSTGNKQEELEVVAQQENYNIVASTETWCDNSHS